MLFVLLATTSVLVVSSLGEQFCKRRVCYFSSSAQYRGTPEARFYPEDINTSLCSHIIYDYAQIVNNTIAATNPLDESTDAVVGSYELMTGLKNDKPELKVLLGLHVTPRTSGPFITMTSTDDSIRQFAANVADFLRLHYFDGLDVQLFYFGRAVTSSETKLKISKVLEELRRAFDEENSGSEKLLLTAAVYGEKILNDDSFDIPSISQNVDWIHFLAVDLNGPWYRYTGHHSPLFSDPDNPGGHDAHFNVDNAVRYWVDGGTPRDKIVLGLPFFGRLFHLMSSSTGVGVISGGALKANYTQSNEFISHFEICELQSLQPHTNVHLEKQGTAYLVAGDVWVSYDDINSVRRKVQYIKDNGLGGFAAYSIDADDIVGHFCSIGPYPLLNAANQECTS